MQLQLIDDLPFATITVAYQGRFVEIPKVLIDTGSATSIFSADQVATIQLFPAPEDILYTIRGVGGIEVVFTRIVDYIQVGTKKLPNFQVEIGGKDYGFDIQGILGMDYLIKVGALIDLSRLDLDFFSPAS
jgi:hypothetical protein